MTTDTIDRVNGTEPAIDLVAAARAEEIRTRAEAETQRELIEARAAADAERIRAQGEADAARTLAAEEARKLQLTNERSAMTLEEKKAAHDTKMAEETRKREEIERATRAAREADETQTKSKAAAQEAVAEADEKWRKYAKRFAILCGIVALPVQIAAFWNEDAPWLVVAPIMLELGAWVVHRGAAAAVANGRPAWHYRTIVWLLAMVAAAVNLSHGLHAFDPATAWATAFASIAGPGVWDLHEHGRIAKRDGRETRRQQKQREKNEKAKRAEEAVKAAELEAKEKAAREAAEQAAKDLAEQRAKVYPDVWEHALKLAAALGETAVTDAVWRQAHIDVKGAPPGEDADILRMRNAAARRVIAARSEAPGETPVKVTKAQAGPQMPQGRRRGNPGGPPVRGVRRPGDTAKYTNAARKQAAITAKQAAEKQGADQ